MDKELFEEINSAVEDRASWETKQEGFYRLRFGGIKRTNKPYDNAPDMHYPLADSQIDKLKPLFVQQLYAGDTLASFVSMKEQGTSDTQSAAEWFDYLMRQKTNFEREMFCGIDQFLECGFITMKAYWHARRKRVCFSVIDNMLVIVPKGTECLQDADWFVHVLKMSKSQYRRNSNFEQGEDVMASIVGGNDAKGQGSSIKSDLEKLREGVAFSSDPDEIILWEVYRREDDSEDAKWVIDTISPARGYDRPVRKTFGLPYDHGMLPFSRIQFEITKKGWYAPRGIPELVGPYQMGLKKLWDMLLQWVDYGSVPEYENNGANPLPNAENYRQQPGGILPPGITRSQSPAAPIDFEKQMGMHRAIAEDRVQIPDLNASEHLGGKQSASGDVTATQINAIVGQSGQGNDLRARGFKLDLADLYKMSWALFVQFLKADRAYLLEDSVKEVSDSSLHLDYAISPNASAESWNKPQQMQKALARFQMFRGDPFIKQAELRKTVLELDDPRLVKRLFTDPGEDLADQVEQQAQEISIMLLGFSPKVSEADDDKAHLDSLEKFFQRRMAAREEITPELARLGLMHGASHIEGLAKKKDPMLEQITEQTLPLVQILQQIATTPENVVQMQRPVQGSPNSQANSPASPDGAAAAPPDQLETAKLAVQKGNMLVNMAKAGMNVNHLELNTVLSELGLPPLADAPIAPVRPAVPVPSAAA